MYSVLPVSYDCPLLIVPSVFSNVYLTCVLCTLYYQFLTIVYFWLHLRDSLTFIWLVCCVLCITSFLRLSLRYSLTCIWLVCCVLCITSFLRLSILIVPSVFSNVYLTCVLCILYYQFLMIVYFWLSLRYSLTFIQPRNISKVINKHIFNSLYTNSAVCRSIESLLYCGLILMSIMKHNKQKMFDRGRLHKVSKELQSCNDTIIHIL